MKTLLSLLAFSAITASAQGPLATPPVGGVEGVGGIGHTNADVNTNPQSPLTPLPGTGPASGALTPPSSAASTDNMATTMMGSPSSPLNRMQIRQLQEALNDDGASLIVDGVVGPKTQTAIRTYQDDHGMSVTGRADADLLDALSIGTGNDGSRAPASTDGGSTSSHPSGTDLEAPASAQPRR